MFPLFVFFVAWVKGKSWGNSWNVNHLSGTWRMCILSSSKCFVLVPGIMIIVYKSILTSALDVPFIQISWLLECWRNSLKVLLGENLCAIKDFRFMKNFTIHSLIIGNYLYVRNLTFKRMVWILICIVPPIYRHVLDNKGIAKLKELCCCHFKLVRLK